MAKQINSKVLIDLDYIDHLVSVLPDRSKHMVQPLLKDNNVDIDEIEDAIVEYDEFWGRVDLSISSSDEESEEDEAALGGIDKSRPTKSMDIMHATAQRKQKVVMKKERKVQR